VVGRGAWQNWSYDVELVNSRTHATLTLSAEQATGATAAGLAAGCVYQVRARARSTAGSGPWSDNFTAQTLAAGTSLLSLCLHTEMLK